MLDLGVGIYRGIMLEFRCLGHRMISKEGNVGLIIYLDVQMIEHKAILNSEKQIGSIPGLSVYQPA